MVRLGFFQGERLELIHGTLLRMPPIGPPHATVVTRLNRLLLLRLADRTEVRVQQPLVAHDESEPEPDIALVPVGDYSQGHPDCALLVVEVADTSLAFDRDTKGPLYAASNVREYWIVDLAAQALDVHRAPSGGRFTEVRRFQRGDRVKPEAFADVEIAVSEILP